MPGRPPIYRNAKKPRMAPSDPVPSDPVPSEPVPSELRPTVKTDPYPAEAFKARPFRFPFFPKEKNSFDPNFNVNQYAHKKELPVFTYNARMGRNQITSRTNKGLYFPNAVEAELQYRGYEGAIDKNDPSKDPVEGEKLIYVEKSGPTSEVTIMKIDEEYVILQNDVTKKTFMLNINDYGNEFMLYKKKSMKQEEPVNWGKQNQNFFENMGGSRKKYRKLKGKSMRKRTRKNVR